MPGVGSSPLSRGILILNDATQNIQRIIPALAGNTMIIVLILPMCPDHPRSRGEYDRGCKIITRQPGSSPLSRGILGLSAATNGVFRIIPALAGNTSSPNFRSCELTDHPRSRGEYCL